tara:strand:+ start:1516 stop:1779 length:264 start_codon:yes stop_codon:yes gene_type:complete
MTSNMNKSNRIVSHQILKKTIIFMALSGTMLSVLQTHDLPRAHKRVASKSVQHRNLVDTSACNNMSDILAEKLKYIAVHYKISVSNS